MSPSGYSGATLPSILTVLSTPSPTDPVVLCPPSTLAIFQARPASLIKLAHDKIHSFSFNEVPVCWRRLFTDASIYEAVRIMEKEVERARARWNSEGEGSGTRKREWDADNDVGGGGMLRGGEVDHRNERRKGKETDDWIQRVVKLLDMAVIMTGAPQREEMIETLLLTLQDFVKEEQKLEVKSPRRKRRRSCNSSAFSTPIKNAPDVQNPVPESPELSMIAFEKHMRSARPLVIQDALHHWPALGERPWMDPEYLMEQTFGGRRLVPVEVGRSYTDEGWGQRILTFGEFMDQYLTKGTTNGGGEKESGIGYLAQHDLFAQIPSLRSDISTPDYCYTDPPPPAQGTPLASKTPQPKLDEPLLNAWFGPAGTVSPLHTDPYHNILCQVVGKKYVRLYSPMETEKLYPRGLEGGGVDMSNTSQVDAEGDARERDGMFPLFREAQYIETILSEGECLYVPVGWWHYVRSLTVSFSVSFWWN